VGIHHEDPVPVVWYFDAVSGVTLDALVDSIVRGRPCRGRECGLSLGNEERSCVVGAWDGRHLVRSGNRLGARSEEEPRKESAPPGQLEQERWWSSRLHVPPPGAIGNDYD
ncbi:uncharacterized protein METZ01_LOCUS21213, partial [marine metagenome]